MKRIVPVVALIAIALLVGWRLRPVVQGGSVAAAKSASGIAADPRRGGTGLPHDSIANNITANLRDAIRRYGPASKQAREIHSFAFGICGDIELNPQQRPAHPKPDRASAWAKLDAECAQFRAQAWSPALMEPSGTPDLVVVWLKQDEATATRLAIESMGEDIELSRLHQAGIWLLERGLYPHQAEYGNMTHEQLALAFNLAARLRTCSAINACGPGSIQTAYACASVGCPPGVSFVDAARRELPPEVYEVALKMRDALVRDAR